MKKIILSILAALGIIFVFCLPAHYTIASFYGVKKAITQCNWVSIIEVIVFFGGITAYLSRLVWKYWLRV